MSFDNFATGFELKELAEDGTFEGFGSVYGNVDEGQDIVEKGAFDASLREHKSRGKLPKMLLQHNPADIVGKWTDMKSTDEGLLVKGKLFSDLPKAKEAYTLMKAGELEGLSIGFRTKDYSFEKGGQVRRIKQADLFEISIVTFPMNKEARISSVKNLTDIRDVERILRDAGVANRVAKLIASHGYKSAMQILDGEHRDDEADEVKRVLEDLSRNLMALKETINA